MNGPSTRASPPRRGGLCLDFAPHSSRARQRRVEGLAQDFAPRTLPVGLYWHIIIETGRPAHQQMAFDEQLAREALPTVRFFSWESPAISLGWKQRPPTWAEELQGQKLAVTAVERPTGGGIAFHGSDLSLAVVVPRALDLSLECLMSAVCQSVVRLCQSYGADATACSQDVRATRVTYCLAETAPYTVLIDGRKVAGLALRRYPGSWLIQGSVLLYPLPRTLTQAIPQEVAESIDRCAIALSEVVAVPLSAKDVARHWASSWSSWWEEALLTALGATCS